MNLSIEGHYIYIYTTVKEMLDVKYMVLLPIDILSTMMELRFYVISNKTTYTNKSKCTKYKIKIK